MKVGSYCLNYFGHITLIGLKTIWKLIIISLKCHFSDQFGLGLAFKPRNNERVQSDF